MVEIEFKKEATDDDYKIIGSEFEKHSKENGITCAYSPFTFIAKNDGEFAGIITGNSYYKEVHIGDLIVVDKFRHNHIGSQLVKTVEEHFKNQGFENMNLSTYAFQAPEFYKKMGFSVDFIRENADEPKLNKYYMSKKM